MGCGNTKEKVENELMEAKMKKIEIEFERQQQMKLLNELGGGNEYKGHIIPDNSNSQLENDNKPFVRKRKTINFTKQKTGRLNPKKSSRSALKKSMDGEDTNSESRIKQRKSLKKKTFK